MRIAVIGSGGREHAVAWKLRQSDKVEIVYTIPGNAGTKNNINLDISNFFAIRNFCESNKIDFLFVGPEQPLTMGIVDFFQDSEILVFGPDKTASQLESSKIFAKQFMNKYKVATANFKTFSQIAPAREFIVTLDGKCVIKYDGLAAGKGVFVCNNKEEAEDALQKIFQKYGSDANILIEELLAGQEISILAFTNGRDYQLLQPSQDHKQLLDGDKGPMTGGMGAFCPVDFCTPEIMDQITKNIILPTMKGLKNEKFNYHGVLYFGLMLTDQGPKVLEYNVRMGDPETEVVLPGLKSDLLKLVLNCFKGNLGEMKLEFNPGYYVDVVLGSGGYPEHYTKGYPINSLLEDDDLIFHAGTKLHNGNIITSGGRVLNIVGNGDDLKSAISDAYAKVAKVNFQNMYYRHDIGNRKT